MNYLMTVPIHTDDGEKINKPFNGLMIMYCGACVFIELLLVSYEIEAPDSTREKQHYQQLK